MKKLKIKELFSKDEKIIDIIRLECEKNNLNIYEVCRDAKIPVATVTNWRNEPGSFSTLKAFFKSIDKLKNIK